MENPSQAEIQTEIQTETRPESKTTQCLNCGTEFKGNFCPECGQSADTGRFTLKFIWENLLAAFLSKDGGIWFTLKNLFTRPGAMIVEILNGKRRNYFSPFPMLFSVLTVYILLFTFTGSRSDIKAMEKDYLEVEVNTDTELEGESEKAARGVQELKKLFGMGISFYNNHYTAVFILTLPVFLFATRTWYGKKNRKRYYRAEYLVAITYSMVIAVLYRCIISLVYPLSASISDKMAKLMPIAIVVALTACFRKMLGFSIAKTAWRSLLAVALYYVIVFIILLTAMLVYGAIFFYRLNH